MCLCRGKLSGGRQDILNQLGHTGIMRGRGFGKVGLQAEAVNRGCRLVGRTCRPEGVFGRFL